jgi:hypothetical protein
MAEATANWYISLFGDERELKQLQKFLDLPNCRLEQFKEKNKGCYLTAFRFSNLTDYEEVLESARKLVTMIRAFAKIELGGDFQSIKIGSGKTVIDTKIGGTLIKREDGRESVWVFPTVVEATAEVLPVTVSGAKPSEPPKREKRLHDDYLTRCDEQIDSAVFDALFYFAQLTSWHTLYKIYKTVESKVTKSKVIGWVGKDKLKEFLYSANHFDALGSPKDAYLGLDGGRHAPSEIAEQQEKAKKRGAPLPKVMSLPEAENLIRTIFVKWLEPKQATI